jgi:hypothetical protein
MQTPRTIYVRLRQKPVRALRLLCCHKICFISIFSILTSVLLTGCAAVAPGNFSVATFQRSKAEQIMERKGSIVQLSGDSEYKKPGLVLLHGATADPSEMMDIARQCSSEYDVFLFSYNYHEPVEKVASEFTDEMTRLKSGHLFGDRVTVITYSYAAIVFREAVIAARDRTLFSDDSLVQLVPTAGGSRLARGMQHRLFAMFITMFSNMSAAEDPYGSVARKLWEGEGNKKFYEVIKPGRMQTILIEGDSHSLERVKDKKVQRRYKNGIGENVIIIPRGAGVMHDFFPTEPAALEYLRKALEGPFGGAEFTRKPAG